MEGSQESGTTTGHQEMIERGVFGGSVIVASAETL